MLPAADHPCCLPQIIYVACRRSSMLPAADRLCCLLQIIYVAWAALNWVLKPSKGKADSSDCITAVVELLHHLLVCKPAEMDMTQACCLGVPILLRFLSSSSIHDRHSCELVKRVLDILAANPSMVIAYKDDRLWSALDQLMTVACKFMLFFSLLCALLWQVPPYIEMYLYQCLSMSICASPLDIY